MIEKKAVLRFQETLMNSWPAQHYYFLNGWILRFTDGITSRANSVIPIRYSGNSETIDNDIEFVEKAYKTYNLPAIFTIPNYFEPPNLETKLLDHRFQQAGCITHTMVNFIQRKEEKFVNENFSYKFYAERNDKSSDFLAIYSSRDGNAQIVLNALSNRIIIPKKQCITAEYNSRVVGTLMGILEPHGYLYLVDMLVHPDFRRQKIAKSMYSKLINTWGIPNGAKMIWLQVESENTNAVKLYTNLGLKKAYSYYYLEKSFKKTQ